jgi:hypothetical protein
MSRSLNPLQQAMVDYVSSIRPDNDGNTARELLNVQKSIDENGTWQEYDEWRISTGFDTRIDRVEIGGKDWFSVRVECDMQEFSCKCPTLEKAYMHSKFYRRLIVDQFYSVGPPWA